jgi:hypothetical protein
LTRVIAGVQYWLAADPAATYLYRGAAAGAYYQTYAYNGSLPNTVGTLVGRQGLLKATYYMYTYSPTGSVTSSAISTDTGIISLYKQLKIQSNNGTSTNSAPVQLELYGDSDAYSMPLNTTKFTIDPADPRIILKRYALDTITASSNTQTLWNMTVAGGMTAKPNHGTILATEIGVASVLIVEKSILGTFDDAIVLTENTDYTVDYSTRTATKIIMASGTGIVSGQSKIRISWIADVIKVGATHNTALKLKIYLNRTNDSETSPSIQPIALGSGKYIELQYDIYNENINT